ncbi:MAG: molecular chaperone TorD family protein [Ferrimonas sp.]
MASVFSSSQLHDLQAQCNVLYHCLYFPPSTNLLEQFQQIHLAEQWPESGESQARERGLTLLAQALQQPLDALLVQVKRDYNALFIGPGDIKVIPWGSPYLHEKRLLMGPSTQALGDFYQHHGIRIQTETNEPVDHIGLMLSTVSELLALQQQGSEEDQLAAQAALSALLRDHLLPWASRFYGLLQSQAETEYYQAIGWLTESVLVALQQQLAIIPKPLQLF